MPEPAGSGIADSDLHQPSVTASAGGGGDLHGDRNHAGVRLIQQYYPAHAHPAADTGWQPVVDTDLQPVAALPVAAGCGRFADGTAIYDFRALVDRQAERVSQKRLAGILDIETTPVDRMVRGLPVRGIRSVMRLDQQSFASEGDLYLFGTVLSQFFALYASINAFHQLEVVNTDNQERYTWTLQQGQQPLM